MKTVLLAAVAALGLMTSATWAATYDFITPGPAVKQLTVGPLTVTPGAEGILNSAPLITRSATGLGVNGRPDLDPGNIDGFPVGSREFLDFSFAWTVKLVNFTLKGWDFDDDVHYSVNGGSWVKVGPGISVGALQISLNQRLKSLRIAAIGERTYCGLFCNIDGLGNDEFRVSQVTTAPVPLPAAGAMLGLGLGALALLRRRRKAA